MEEDYIVRRRVTFHIRCHGCCGRGVRNILIAIVLLATNIQQAAGQTQSNTSTTVSPPAVEPVEALLPDSVTPNGTLSVSARGDDDLYGSSVKLRRASDVIGDAFTIWIDTKHPLPTGHLQYFYLFIEQTLPSAPASNLWLQVWRQTGHADDYQLVWQRLVYLNDSASQALYSFNVSGDEFQVSEGDLIGWTGVDNYRFISRSDAVRPRCYDCSRYRFILDLKDFWLPTVRTEPYRSIVLSSRQFFFSVAVRIKRPATKPVVVPVSLSTRVVSSTLRPLVSFSTSTVRRGGHENALSTTTVGVIVISDHTTAVTVGVIFGILGVVIIAITAAVVWKRRDDCVLAIFWSASKKEAASRDSRLELLDSGSSTPGSTEHGNDVDSSSVTTSSSSEVTAAAGTQRHRGIGMAIDIDRQRYWNRRGQDPVLTPPPTYAEYADLARDNKGFVDDELTGVKCAQNKQIQLPHQQQQQQPVTCKAADTRTMSVSVDLHTPPHNQAGLATGNESMV